jgi:4-alpha-glucanotransferase
VSHPARRSPLDRRRAGLLLHPTSLPGGIGGGDLGAQAFGFVDFLVSAGFTVWQTLPLGPTHAELSPYRCRSAHAGNELLISLERLVEEGLLPADGGPQRDEPASAYRRRRLTEAYRACRSRGHESLRHQCEEFRARHAFWIEGYALYEALRETQDGRPWWEWPAELRRREPGALAAARERLGEAVEQRCFEQFIFYRQWGELRRYANSRGVLVFGDIPLYVADDSADVWASSEYFLLDEHGRPRAVAGVPPDYFSATGQRWGNPLYDWQRMVQDGFAWWVERVRTQLEQFDLLRIDHFRGLQAYWEIPASDSTAVNGRWVEAPGQALLQQLRDTFRRLPLIAEDLGYITPEVSALRERFDLPGMKVLQFAFGGAADNPYLPHNHPENAVVYTGTHDNNTTLGWFHELDAGTRQHVIEYLGCRGDEMPTALTRAALASVARLAILPMQDVLRLGSDQRMNAPGTHASSNWRWRFSWDQLAPGTAQFYLHLIGLYGRL